MSVLGLRDSLHMVTHWCPESCAASRHGERTFGAPCPLPALCPLPPLTSDSIPLISVAVRAPFLACAVQRAAGVSLETLGQRPSHLTLHLEGCAPALSSQFCVGSEGS